MERASTPFGPNNQPAVSRSLLAKDLKVVLSKTLRHFVVIMRVSVLANLQIHFLNKGGIEKVQRRFVKVVCAVLAVGFVRPVYPFAAEIDILVHGHETPPCPVFNHRPLVDNLGCNERLFYPFGLELFSGKCVYPWNLVLGRYVLVIRFKRDVTAHEWSI